MPEPGRALNNAGSSGLLVFLRSRKREIGKPFLLNPSNPLFVLGDFSGSLPLNRALLRDFFFLNKRDSEGETQARLTFLKMSVCLTADPSRATTWVAPSRTHHLGAQYQHLQVGPEKLLGTDLACS